MRREPLLAGLLCVAGALLVLVAAGRAWVSVAVAGSPLLPPQGLAVTGSDLVPGMTALGLVGLAGVPALAATRGRGRIGLGVVLALVGLGVATAVLRLAAGGLADAALRTEAVQQPGAAASSTSLTLWPWVCLLGGLLLVAAGLLVALRGPRWAALGRRYEAPAATAPSAAVAERDLWEALDRGEDPTGAHDEQPDPETR